MSLEWPLSLTSDPYFIYLQEAQCNALGCIWGCKVFLRGLGHLRHFLGSSSQEKFSWSFLCIFTNKASLQPWPINSHYPIPRDSILETSSVTYQSRAFGKGSRKWGTTQNHYLNDMLMASSGSLHLLRSNYWSRCTKQSLKYHSVDSDPIRVIAHPLQQVWGKDGPLKLG